MQPLVLFVSVKGSKIKPDPLANKNEKRRNFCAKFDGYGEFCESKYYCLINCFSHLIKYYCLIN